jgi:hypothetical protein
MKADTTRKIIAGEVRYMDIKYIGRQQDIFKDKTGKSQLITF